MATRSTGRGDLPRISGLVGGGAGWDLVPRYSSVRARDPLPGQRPQSQLCAGPGPSAWLQLCAGLRPSAWSVSPGCHGGCRPCFLGGPATTSAHLPPRAAAAEHRVSTCEHPRQGDASVGGGTALGLPSLRGHGCPPVCTGPSAHSVGEGVPRMYVCFQPCGKACARTRVCVNWSGDLRCARLRALRRGSVLGGGWNQGAERLLCSRHSARVQTCPTSWYSCFSCGF